jgi:L-alanine-DL-glutamate epimerase-like enolase superfamily enzyme
MREVYTEAAGERSDVSERRFRLSEEGDGAMKITDVSLTLFEWDDIPPTQYGQHSRFAGSSALGLLRIATDDGVEGAALVPRPGAGALLEQLVTRVLRDELVGVDPLRREWLWHRMWEIDRTEELPLYLLGIVDVALWDLAGRAAGEPV